MRVAVFSDVQGNLPAMEAAVEHILAWQPDLVIMAGDLVNRGPRSDACLARFEALREERGWLPVRGNHEDWVLHCGRSEPADAHEADMRRMADWTRARLAALAPVMADWPDHLCFHGAPAHTWVHVTHGSLAGNRDGISASVADEALAGKLPEDIALFVTAHTHKPLLRRYRGVDILNVGSVGSPFDGDVRASYGRLELRDGRWRARIERIPYDRAAAERDFVDSGFLDQAGPLARIVLDEWRSARLLMPAWHRRYREAVRAGDIGLEESVDEFLRDVSSSR